MSLDTSIVLKAEPRAERGKNAMRRLRAAERIPVTIYGHGDAAAGTVAKREMAALLRAHGRNQVITLNFNGSTSPVKIAAMQLDPVRGTLMHADLMRISLTEKTEFDVPVHIVGEPEGVRIQGGMLDLPSHSIRIRCLPGDLPQAIEVDVTHLRIGDHFRVSDLKLASDMETVTDGEVIIATVIGHKEAEETPAEGIGTAEAGVPEAK